MNTKLKAMKSLLTLVLISLLVSACGPGQLFGPTITPSSTVTPTATRTPTPTRTSTPVPPTATVTPAPPTPTETSLPDQKPKSGHWQGEPSVSFDVTADGKIRNFKIAALFSNSTCTITRGEAKVEEDGTFIISEAVLVGDNFQSTIELAAALGLPTPGVTQSSSGEMIDAVKINGKFTSPTKVTGTYLVIACEDQIGFSSRETPTWSAEWNGP